MPVAELTLLKSFIYLSVRAADAGSALRTAVAVYQTFVSRLYGQNTGARGIRIEMEEPVQRKDDPGVWDCPAVMRAEVPSTVQALGTTHYVDAWRKVVRQTWAQVTRELEQHLVRSLSYVALTRPAVPGEEKVEEAKPEQPKRLIPITVRLGGQVFHIEVPDTDTLLDGCLDKGVNLKFQCKAGVCDECRVRVIAGMENLPPVNEAEMNMLGDKIQQGYRLSCQVTIKGPVEIEQ